jgi:hypothetical protein
MRESIDGSRRCAALAIIIGLVVLGLFMLGSSVDWRALHSATPSKADEADECSPSGPTGHGGVVLRVLALRRAPNARSLSAVFDGRRRVPGLLDGWRIELMSRPKSP